MICARRVALDGNQLDQANSAVVIQSIEAGEGKENFSAVSLAGGYGQRVTGHHRDTVDIVVRFALKIRHTSLSSRASALEDVNTWAARAVNGAWLTVNYKTNRRIWVKLVQAPGEGSLWDYTKEFQITFRAYGVPYWEEIETENTASLSAGTLKTGTISVTGNADTVADVTFENESENTVNACTITVDGNSFNFDSLGLAAGETLVISHENDGILKIRILETDEDYRDAMSKRLPTSADDLRCRTGTRNISFTSDYSCSMDVSCKGRFL